MKLNHKKHNGVGNAWPFKNNDCVCVCVFFFAPFRIVSRGILKHCKNKYLSLNRNVNSRLIPSFWHFQKKNILASPATKTIVTLGLARMVKTERHLIRIRGVCHLLSLISDIIFVHLMFFFKIHLYEGRKNPTARKYSWVNWISWAHCLSVFRWSYIPRSESSNEAIRKLPIEQFDTEFKSTIKLYRNKTRYNCGIPAIIETVIEQLVNSTLSPMQLLTSICSFSLV